MVINQAKEIIKKITPRFIIGGYHFLWAWAGAVFFGFPSKKLKVVGVTGTNGKTTTVEMISAILKEAGFRVALSSSIKFEIASDISKNLSGNSMPGRFFLQKFLRQAVRKKCDWAVIEATSEGIKQHRHRFISFDAAVFTNLTPEHIESHGGFDNYRKAKLGLFKAAENIHIINREDENAGYFLELKARKKFCYGISSKENGDCVSVAARGIKTDSSGSEFEVQGAKFKINLTGLFNVYNALAAICLALSQGIGLEACQKALARISSIPGRMEKISSSPDIYIDYAFTPNALEKVYSTLKNDLARGAKLICLLGACGGGRDKWKRPVLGQIAAKFCDRIILTNEDPFDENPREIINAIKKGVSVQGFPAKNLHEIVDRRQAIAKTLSFAGQRDKIILTGKGCEPWIRLEHGKKIPWDEKTVALEELTKTNH